MIITSLLSSNGSSENTSIISVQSITDHRYYRLRNRDWKHVTLSIHTRGQSVSPWNPEKLTKIDKNSLKMEHFSNTFDNISGLKAFTNLKIRYPSGGGLLLATAATINSVCQYLKRSSPNNQTVSKWRRFCSFSTFYAQSKPLCSQKLAIPVEAHHSSAVSFSFWQLLLRELRYSPKTCFVQGIMAEYTETL